MPIDLVIDERDGGKSELGVGDSNNNANRSTADSTSHTTEGSSSTPDMVSTFFLQYFSQYFSYLFYNLSRLHIKDNFFGIILGSFLMFL